MNLDTEITTAYELSAEQVAGVREWLESWGICPWCDQAIHFGLAPTEPHLPDCLLAEICGIPA